MAVAVLALTPLGAAITLHRPSDEPVPLLGPEAQRVLLEVSTARFARPGQQKEAFEFLWTPGLVLQQTLEQDVQIVYPPE